MNEEINRLQQIINGSKNIVFFGGAGVSTESGIPDFRSETGLYSQKFKYPPETMLSRPFFNTHTEEFFEFYKAKMIPHNIKPNAAHIKLAELERAGRLSGVVTQNIDGLHTLAGSKKVFELHGSIHRNFCMKCGKSYGLSSVENADGIPRCACSGIIKPDVVLYGENLNNDTVSGAVEAIVQADTLIIAGTSLTVYPAAGFIEYFQGEHIVLINRAPTAADSRAELVIRQNVGDVLSCIAIDN